MYLYLNGVLWSEFTGVIVCVITVGTSFISSQVRNMVSAGNLQQRGKASLFMCWEPDYLV